jgi:hypothetical protein
MTPQPHDFVETLPLFEQSAKEGGEAFTGPFLLGQCVVHSLLDGDVPGWHAYASTYVVLEPEDALVRMIPPGSQRARSSSAPPARRTTDLCRSLSIGVWSEVGSDS